MENPPSSPTSLHGPVSIPTEATHLLVCLHGFGDEGQSYLAFAPLLDAALTSAIPTLRLGLACPNAPSPTPFGQGYQWFSDNNWTFRDPRGIAHAATLLETYLADLSNTHNIPRSHIALLGFSQGAMTMLYSLPQLSAAPPCAVACSGALVVKPPVPATAHRCPVLFTHGKEDDVLPADTTVAAEAFFRQHGYPTTLHLVDNLAHGIDTPTLTHIITHLATHLPA